MLYNTNNKYLINSNLNIEKIDRLFFKSFFIIHLFVKIQLKCYSLSDY
jgi:hypothetical protein